MVDEVIVVVKTQHLFHRAPKIRECRQARFIPTGTTGSANRDVNNVVSMAVLLVR